MGFLSSITKPFKKVIQAVGSVIGGIFGLTSDQPVVQEAAPAAPEAPDPVAPTPEDVTSTAGDEALNRDRRRRRSYASTISQRPFVPSLGGGKTLLGQ